MVEIKWVIGFGVSLIGTLLVLFMAMWRHIDKRFEVVEDWKTEQETVRAQFRLEVYKELKGYARRDDHDDLKEQLTSIYDQLRELSAQLNQLLGQYRGKDGKCK